jgi:hypothetical protein
MHHLECTYELHQKSFYTNNHGKYVDRRIDYVWSYLHELEPCFPVFVKLRLEEVEKIKTEDRLNQELQGHTFTRDGTEYREFHVDCCLEFFDLLMSTPLDNRYSEKLSPEDERCIPSSHDEALVNQYDYSKKCWRGSKGQQVVRPKEKGRNLMMSTSFVSRVFGWDPHLTKEQLEAINDL